ncbi:MAG TPA: CHAD domain-containing protein [Caulobacteraceae bacterium]
MSSVDASEPPSEVELKLAIASDSARSAADREVGRGPARSVETIYFDTPRRRLQSAGFSLRLRRDGENWSQSVKGNGGGLTRFEQDYPLRGGLPDFSLLDGTPLAALVGVEDRPAPVFVTRVQRRSRRRAANGSRIEFSLDEGEVIARDRSWPILELELELKGGAREALFSEGRRLAERDAFVPAFMSKAERGFALVDGLLGEPVKFGAHPLGAEVSATEAFQTLARRCLRQLSLNADLIVGGKRLEAVHQARTSLRRLRVALALFKPVLPAGRSGAIRAELKWLATELAEARNLDVFMFETFRPTAERIADRAAAAAFGKALLHANTLAHERAAAAIASPRFRLLLLDVARWIETELDPALAHHDTGPRAADFAHDALGEQRRALRRRLETLDWSDPEARHKTRIAAKKMRYASEFFLDLGPRSRASSYRPFIKSLAVLQDRFGRLNDLAVAEPMIPVVLGATIAEPAEAQKVAYAAGLIMGRALGKSKGLTKSARRAGAEFLDAPIWW